jgi:long-subunit acyl-CoA synthetase (AMP-forming)
MPSIPESHLLLQSLYSHESTHPDAIYLTQPVQGGVETFTFKQVLDQARRVAAYLRSLDFPPGSRIAIVSKNCAHFFVAELAIWMAGHVSVALYLTLSADTVRYILEHSEARLLFVGKLDMWDEMKGGVPEGLPRVGMPLAPPNDYESWDTILESHQPLEGNPTRAADELALVLYTSGSTGEPKGVMHDFANLAVAARGIVEVLGTSRADRMLSYLPLAHAMERWIVEACSMVTGMQVFFAESLDTFIQDLQRAQPTLFISVPRLWLKFQQGVFAKMPPERLRLLLKIPVLNNVIKKKILSGLGLQSVRFAGSGSAPIPGELIQWYRDLGLDLLEGYGMSENLSYSHVSMPGRGRVGYVGEAYPGVDCKISEEGEILVRSPANMLGYYKNEEATREAFTEDGFLRTGDRGELDELGRLKITGRVKELFKTSKGKYIAPAPIENLINADPSVELSCVAGNGHPTPFAYVLLAEDLRSKLSDPATRSKVERDLVALLDRVNGMVESYERLGFLAVTAREWTIDDGDLTPTMKIRRSALEAAFSPHLDEWYAQGTRVVWES